VSSDSIEVENHQQLVEVVSEISSQISGHLRSLIIKESSVESLCRVVHTLSQDVISQLEGTRIHQALYQKLDEHLLRTTSDARERLVYCSEVTLRQQVRPFIPPLCLCHSFSLSVVLSFSDLSSLSSFERFKCLRLCRVSCSTRRSSREPTPIRSPPLHKQTKLESCQRHGTRP
jgi:hypothetical protein